MTQDDAFKVLTMGKNVFLTGAPGSGKTFVLTKYITWLKERGIEPAITASTGIAATHIGGQTIHSWSGIGIQNSLSEYDLDRMEQNEKLVKRIQKTHVLILDEVSMIRGGLLDMVNVIMQRLSHSYEPFGGKQVVFCGDFFQLPPISRDDAVTFAFEAKAWSDAHLHVCYLNEQHRQSDEELLTVLKNIREGTVSSRDRSLISSRISSTPPVDAPHLYTHNIDVDRLNTEKLIALSGPLHNFTMKTKGSKAKVEALKKGLLVPEVLSIKKGAVVMFVKNHPFGYYVNGTVGTVTGFKNTYPVVKTKQGDVIVAEPESWRFEEGDTVRAEVTQVPLRLAWALTIHKSQGATLDAAYIDLSKTFVEGQGYVALSRVRSLSGLHIKGIDMSAFIRHERVAHEDVRCLKASERTVARLARTENDRVQEISNEFIARCGGHEPTPLSKATFQKLEKVSTLEKTRELLLKDANIRTIAKVRSLTEETIINHIEKLLEKQLLFQKDIAHLMKDMSEDDIEIIETAFKEKKSWALSPVKSLLQDSYTFADLRFARLFIRPWGEE